MRVQPPEPSQRAGQSQRSRWVRDVQTRDGRTQVVVLTLQFLEPILFIGPAPRIGALGECLEMCGMAFGEGIAVRAAASCSSAKSRMVSSISNCSPVLRIMLWSTSAASVSISASQTDSAASSVKPPAIPRAARTAPVRPDRGVHGSTAACCAASAADAANRARPRQQLEAVAEPLQQRDRRQQRHPRCRQLDRQRQAVHAHAEFGDRGGIFRGDPEVRLRGLRALTKKRADA